MYSLYKSKVIELLQLLSVFVVNSDLSRCRVNIVACSDKSHRLPFGWPSSKEFLLKNFNHRAKHTQIHTHALNTLEHTLGHTHCLLKPRSLKPGLTSLKLMNNKDLIKSRMDSGSSETFWKCEECFHTVFTPLHLLQNPHHHSGLCTSSSFPSKLLTALVSSPSKLILFHFGWYLKIIFVKQCGRSYI